jgi:putative transposase
MNAGLKVRAGETAVAEGRRYQIEKVVNLESVLARDLETGDLQRLLLTQLLPAPPLTTEQNVTMASPDPQPAPEADWQRAHARFAVIRPLLEQGNYSRREVEARAHDTGYGPATLYRWLAQYQSSGYLSTLIPNPPGLAQGQHLLRPEVNTIVEATIEDTYLSERKPSIRRTALEVERRCHNANLPPPHRNTVRHRILQVSPHQKQRRREGHQAARAGFEPIRGPYGEAD